MLSYDILLVKGGCPCLNGGHSNGGSRAYKRDLADDSILRRHQDETEMAILAPSTVNLDQLHGCCEDPMHILDGRVVRFPRINVKS